VNFKINQRTEASQRVGSKINQHTHWLSAFQDRPTHLWEAPTSGLIRPRDPPTRPARIRPSRARCAPNVASGYPE